MDQNDRITLEKYVDKNIEMLSKYVDKQIADRDEAIKLARAEVRTTNKSVILASLIGFLGLISGILSLLITLLK